MEEGKQHYYMAGVRAAIPVICGFVPVGMAYALLARQTGFGVMETISFSVIVFAGASQMMAVEMFTQNAGIAAVIAATFVLNLRHLVMSTYVMDAMREKPLNKRLLASFGVTDESFALFSAGAPQRYPWAYFMGLITVTYPSWVAGTAAGAITADFLPPVVVASFGVALYAVFISILAPSMARSNRVILLVAATAAVNIFLNQILQPSWALIISAISCAAAGAWWVDVPEKESRRKPRSETA